MADNQSDSTNHQTPIKRPLQYSLLSLLVLMTIVAICLAFGVYYPRFTMLLLTLSVANALAMLFADWLIRPVGHRSLTRITVGAWAAVGSILLVWASRELINAVKTDGGTASWVITACLIVAGGFCCHMAWRCYRGR